MQKFFYLATFFFLFWSNLFAQDTYLESIVGGDKVLTPQQAVEIAIKQNPQLQKFRETINQKKAERLSAFGIYSPSLIFMQEGIPSNDFSQFAEKRWTLSQELDFPYYSFLKIKHINEQVDAMETEYQWKIKEIKAEVKQAYSRVVYYLELIRLRNEIKEITNKLYEIVKTKVDLGQINNLDLLNAEIAKLEAENDYNDAIRNLMLARYDLFFVMGLDPDDQQYTISFQDSLQFFDFVIPQEEILSKLEQTFDYQSAKKMEKATETFVAQSWSSLLPAINFNFYKQNYSTGFNFTGFEVGLRVPLWIGLDKQTEIQQAQSKLRESQFNTYEARLRIKRQIEHSWHSFDISREIILNYKNNISEKTQQLLELTLESYQLGQTDLLNLLNVQKTYITSKIRYIDALKDYYNQIIDLEKYLDQEIVFP